MKKPYILLPLIVAGLLVLGASCGKKATNQNTNTAAEPENTNSAVTNTSAESNTNTSVNTNTSSSSNTNTSTTTSGSLTLTKPEKDATVASPIEVEGTANGDTVTVRILNTSGKEIVAVPVTVRSGKYHVNLSFTFTNTTSGTIEVAESDGTKVSAPVKFTVAASASITADTNTSSDTNTNSSDDTSDDTNSNSAY